MNTGVQYPFWILVFPGFLFTLVLGLAASWLVRKVSALVQWRVGPPCTQPLVDIMKLLGKEVLIPEEAHLGVFVAAPLVGLSGVLLLATMLWRSLASETAFVGDVIVALYLMALPSLALILGSSASASPHAALGTSREMKLVLSYELPLALALVVVLIKAIPAGDPAPSLSLAGLAQHTPVLSLSGLLAFLAAILSVQAKLGFIPFDMAESETELAGGVLIEYSGVLLALWKVMQALMLVALTPLFGGGLHGRDRPLRVVDAVGRGQARLGMGADDPDQEHESACSNRPGDAFLLGLLRDGIVHRRRPGDDRQALRTALAVIVTYEQDEYSMCIQLRFFVQDSRRLAPALPG